jgi:hypothetical protein
LWSEPPILIRRHAQKQKNSTICRDVAIRNIIGHESVVSGGSPRLGHASLETTRGYLHHTRDELERSMRAPERSILDAAADARTRRNGRRAS